MYKINKISIIFSLLVVLTFIFIYSKVDFKFLGLGIDTYKSNNSSIDYFYKRADKINKSYKFMKSENSKNKAVDKEWRLEIDSINLKAKISEGTDQNTLNKYIGHFENTKKETGNIGLAAHNRGYKVNYFQNIKNLKLGDRINYFYNGKKYIYEVYEKSIILDTDWTVLENKKNELTLITCVENKDEYRRCIKAKKIYNSEDM